MQGIGRGAGPAGPPPRRRAEGPLSAGSLIPSALGPLTDPHFSRPAGGGPLRSVLLAGHARRRRCADSSMHAMAASAAGRWPRLRAPVSWRCIKLGAHPLL